MRKLIGLGLFLPLVIGCSGDDGSSETNGPPADTGSSVDSSVSVDSGSPVDSGSDDTGSAEDSSMPDTTVADTAMPDTTVVDTAKPDTATPDTAVVDTGTDTGTIDTGPDAPIEVGPPAPTCTDAIKNGTETDIDCGGATCSKCANDKGCTGVSDCVSGICTAGKCAAPSCTDAIKNGTETDIDCGGTSCPKCGDAKACSAAGDCLSGLCSSGKCVTPSCVDGLKNGTETDIDCGGSCPGCNPGKACLVTLDCYVGACATNVCREVRSCKELHTLRPELPSGTYPIDPDGAGSIPAFNVYCDMTADGGGWTKILHTPDGGYNSTTGALGSGDVGNGSISVPSKLSDAQINAIVNSALATYRFQGDKTSLRTYLRSSTPWNDPARGMGILPAGTPTCEAANLAACTFGTTTYHTIDTLAWGLVANDCNRFFTDYNTNANCWPSGSSGFRCWKAGVSCSAAGEPDHPLIRSLSIWFRE